MSLPSCLSKSFINTAQLPITFKNHLELVSRSWLHKVCLCKRFLAFGSRNRPSAYPKTRAKPVQCSIDIRIWIASPVDITYLFSLFHHTFADFGWKVWNKIAQTERRVIWVSIESPLDTWCWHINYPHHTYKTDAAAKETRASYANELCRTKWHMFKLGNRYSMYSVEFCPLVTTPTCADVFVSCAMIKSTSRVVDSSNRLLQSHQHVISIHQIEAHRPSSSKQPSYNFINNQISKSRP